MSVRLALVLSLALLLPVTPSALAGPPPQTDRKGCTDPELFPTRMPGYLIGECDSKEYDVYEFWPAKPGKRIPQEGRKTIVHYRWPTGQGKPTMSGLEIVRNYEAAIAKIGGTTQNIRTTGPDPFVNATIVKDGREVWVQVTPRGGGNGIEVAIVEKKVMEQHIVADAASFGNDLKGTGHTAVYGIFFDTGKAELKPESAAALQEIAKLLGADPGLRLFVVGHTDAVGVFEDNMRLSQARAEAVVKALTGTHGVAAARLRPYGVASLAPVASNAAEEGRAKNRRVELVQQ